MSELSTTETIYTANPKIKTLNLDLSNPEEVELVLKKIHTFRYLESLTLDGEADENTLKKLFYRVSVLKNLNKVTFRENELKKMPETISTLRNLQSITIEGNTSLDYSDLCFKLKSLPLTELKLLDNDIKKTPPTISQLTSLKKLTISGSNQLDYSVLVDQLTKVKGLTTLSIPVNYISELPKNIDQLKALQVLDVSNNNLTELPKELSSLKAINKLSIQGNLLVDPAKDLENLKDNTIQYLALDKEISGEDLERIKKMFPTAQIYFPLNEEEPKEPAAVKEQTVSPQRTGELRVKKEARLLSGAYALYPVLFQPIVYTFDTLTFEERYKDLRYAGTSRIMRAGVMDEPPFHFRTLRNRGEGKGKRKEIWFYFPFEGVFQELRAFSGMYWVYKGPLTKKQFKKTYLKIRRRPSSAYFFPRVKRKFPIGWNDIRVIIDKNNSQFTIQLKSDTGFSEFTACPVFAYMDPYKNTQTYTKKYLLYQRFLQRRSQNFKKQQAREKATYDRNYNKVKEYAWKELQLRMSDEEKLMSQEDWLEYYDNIVANEEEAINGSSLSTPFILRSLALKSYAAFAEPTNPSTVATRSNTAFYRTKSVEVDFMNANGAGKLAVANIIVLDSKNKLYYMNAGTLGLLPNTLSLQQFAGYKIIIQMRNGDWGAVDTEEIDKQNFESSETLLFKTQVFDKNLDTIGDLLQSSLK
ncbi:hypothetical protein CNR22_23710 [Sphingobacteriaceae bacterium]|nr:hypothetical protein CNR22_23710 [Sphingobacteriaceae bacterium]